MFRAFFGEGQTADLFTMHMLSHPRHREMVHTNDTNLKKVFKSLMQIYTCLSPHSLEMVVEI
jgi:hypothetical protein